MTMLQESKLLIYNDYDCESDCTRQDCESESECTRQILGFISLLRGLK